MYAPNIFFLLFFLGVHRHSETIIVFWGAHLETLGVRTRNFREEYAITDRIFRLDSDGERFPQLEIPPQLVEGS